MESEQEWNVQWLNACNKDKLFKDLFALREKISVPLDLNEDVTFSVVSDFIKCEFKKVNKKNFLFILDNFIESITWTNEFIRTLPENVRVLVTSTDRMALSKFEQMGELNRIEFKYLSKEKSEAILKNKTQKEFTQQDLILLENLLPYDLHLLELCFKENSSLVLSEFLADKSIMYKKMFEEIRKIVYAQSKDAWYLLECFGYIDYDAIPVFLVDKFLKKIDNTDAFNVLVKLNMVELFECKHHQCLRIDRKTRDLMRLLYDDENIKREVSYILFKEMPKIEKYTNPNEIWNKAIVLVNHLARVYRDSGDLNENEINAGLMEKISRYNFYMRTAV